jgi:hypothetical protein
MSRPERDRLPVLVKSVLSAPVPLYALLTPSALSAQTVISVNTTNSTIPKHSVKVWEHVDPISFFEDTAIEELFCYRSSC